MKASIVKNLSSFSVWVPLKSVKVSWMIWFSWFRFGLPVGLLSVQVNSLKD